MSNNECGEEGEVLARRFLRAAYKGWKIRKQVRHRDVPKAGKYYPVHGPPYRRYDFVVTKGRATVRYEVKSVESIGGTFFLSEGQLADVDRVLLILRGEAAVLDLGSRQVLRKCSRFKRIYQYGDRLTIRLTRLESYLRERMEQDEITKFRVTMDDDYSCSVECYFPGDIRAPAREFFKSRARETISGQEIDVKPAH